MERRHVLLLGATGLIGSELLPRAGSSVPRALGSSVADQLPRTRGTEEPIEARTVARALLALSKQMQPGTRIVESRELRSL